MRVLGRYLLAAAAIVLTATGLTAREIFVSPDGSDSGDGAWGRPFKTIGKAAGQAAAAKPGEKAPTVLSDYELKLLRELMK